MVKGESEARRMPGGKVQGSKKESKPLSEYFTNMKKLFYYQSQHKKS
jgi:hypothetical protein